MLPPDHPLVLAERVWATAQLAGVEDVAYDCRIVGDTRCMFIHDNPELRIIALYPYGMGEPPLLWFSEIFGRTAQPGYLPSEWFDVRSQNRHTP
jgi:hypothetical protein